MNDPLKFILIDNIAPAVCYLGIPFENIPVLFNYCHSFFSIFICRKTISLLLNLHWKFRRSSLFSGQQLVRGSVVDGPPHHQHRCLLQPQLTRTPTLKTTPRMTRPGHQPSAGSALGVFLPSLVQPGDDLFSCTPASWLDLHKSFCSLLKVYHHIYKYNIEQ